MGVFRLSPVELPTGVGPKFEVSRIQSVWQGEKPAAPSVAHLHQLAFYEEPVVVPQLGVQHAADLARPTAVRPAGKRREPDRIAQEVASIVHLHEHLLLRDALAYEPRPFSKLFQWWEVVTQRLYGVFPCFLFADNTIGDALFLLRALDDLIILPEGAVIARHFNGRKHVVIAVHLAPLWPVLSRFPHAKHHGACMEIRTISAHGQVRHLGVAFIVTVIDVDIQG